jgi:hypothetical protein
MSDPAGTTPPTPSQATDPPGIRPNGGPGPQTGLRTHQPVTNHEDLLGVVDGLLEDMGLDRRDAGGTVSFAGLDPLRPTVLKTGPPRPPSPPPARSHQPSCGGCVGAKPKTSMSICARRTSTRASDRMSCRIAR